MKTFLQSHMKRTQLLEKTECKKGVKKNLANYSGRPKAHFFFSIDTINTTISMLLIYLLGYLHYHKVPGVF